MYKTTQKNIKNYDQFFMACELEALFWDKLYTERVDVGGGLC